MPRRTGPSQLWFRLAWPKPVEVRPPPTPPPPDESSSLARLHKRILAWYAVHMASRLEMPRREALKVVRAKHGAGPDGRPD